MISSSNFVHSLPKSRVGRKHESYQSFHSNAIDKTITTRKQKEYTLIVIIQSSKATTTTSTTTKKSSNRILLGIKHRGFGKGFYNSFGGKIDPNDESIVDGAVRELKEETNIDVSKNIMEECSIGKLHFTFDDDVQLEMIIHLFMVDLSKDLKDWDDEEGKDSNSIIQGCDEITPIWFDDWHTIPLNQMFADDSIWLSTLLSSYLSNDHCNKLKLNFWGHYDAGGQDVNSMLHYYLQKLPQNEPKEPLSLEKRMFHQLHTQKVNNPTIKEFKESWAFANTVKSYFPKHSFDVVIDVAGGHGALAAIFLSLTSALEAIVIDPAIVSSGIRGIEQAWHPYFFPNKVLRYRHEMLQTALVDELERIVHNTDRTRVLVVACHACQHLTQDTIDISERYGVHIAVMSCCQKDITGSWKSFCSNINNTTNTPASIDIGTVIDLLTAGQMMNTHAGSHAGVSYTVKMKMIDISITPQNRIILCKAVERSTTSSNRHQLEKDKIEIKLNKAYARAHKHNNSKVSSEKKWYSYSCDFIMQYLLYLQCVTFGIGVGVIISFYIL